MDKKGRNVAIRAATGHHGLPSAIFCEVAFLRRRQPRLLIVSSSPPRSRPLSNKIVGATSLESTGFCFFFFFRIWIEFELDQMKVGFFLLYIIIHT